MAHKLHIPIKPEQEKNAKVNVQSDGKNTVAETPVAEIPIVETPISTEPAIETSPTKSPEVSADQIQEDVAIFYKLYDEFNINYQSVSKDTKKCKFSQFANVIKLAEKALSKSDELMEYIGIGQNEAIKQSRSRIIDTEKKKNEIIAYITSLNDEERLKLFPKNSLFADFNMADVTEAISLIKEAQWLPDVQRENLLTQLEGKKNKLDTLYRKATKRNGILSLLGAFISVNILLSAMIFLSTLWSWSWCVIIVIYACKVVNLYKQLHSAAKVYGEKHGFKILMRALSFF